MSFFHKKKMSQNLWATIMPFGPVTNILLAPKKNSFQALTVQINIPKSSLPFFHESCPTCLYK